MLVVIEIIIFKKSNQWISCRRDIEPLLQQSNRGPYSHPRGHLQLLHYVVTLVTPLFYYPQTILCRWACRGPGTRLSCNIIISKATEGVSRQGNVMGNSPKFRASLPECWCIVSNKTNQNRMGGLPDVLFSTEGEKSSGNKTTHHQGKAFVYSIP